MFTKRECYINVILDPKGGDARSVCPGVKKKNSGGEMICMTSTRLAIDPTTARKSRNKLGKN